MEWNEGRVTVKMVEIQLGRRKIVLTKNQLTMLESLSQASEEERLRMKDKFDDLVVRELVTEKGIVTKDGRACLTYAREVFKPSIEFGFLYDVESIGNDVRFKIRLGGGRNLADKMPWPKILPLCKAIGVKQAPMLNGKCASVRINNDQVTILALGASEA